MSLFKRKSLTERQIAKAQAANARAESKIGKPRKKQKEPIPKKDGAFTLEKLLFYDIVDDD